MDENTKVGFATAVAILRRLLEVQLAATGRLPKAVVTLGGTALSAHRIRAQTDDLDVYLSEIDDDAVAQVEEEGKRRHGDRFKIDATPVNTIWGEIAIRDIESSPVVEDLSIGGHTVVVRALSVETLYVVKVAADRPKDRADQPLIASRTTFEKVVVRANLLFPSYGDRDGLPAFAERLGRCLARDYSRSLDEVTAAFELSDAVRKRMADHRRSLESAFLQALKTSMQRNPDLIAPRPDRPDLLGFDAVTAGAPEEVRNAMDANEREVSDMAGQILKVHDLAFYVRWLRGSRFAGPEQEEASAFRH